MSLKADLESRLAELGAALDERALALAVRHAALIQEWNHAAHLVSSGDAENKGLARHLAEAAVALPFLPAVGSIVDVGSGGGFPGLAWACMHAGPAYVLIEPARRKAAFLRDAVHLLGLTKVEVLQENIGTAARLQELGADLLTTRATGLTRMLLEAAGATTAGRLLLYLSAAEAAGLAASPPTGLSVRARIALGRAPGGGEMLVLEKPAPG